MAVLQSARDQDGNEVPLAKYMGKVTIFVNLASKCGYTKSNYEGLTELYREYHPKGVEVRTPPPPPPNPHPHTGHTHLSSPTHPSLFAPSQPQAKLHSSCFRSLPVSAHQQIFATESRRQTASTLRLPC